MRKRIHDRIRRLGAIALISTLVVTVAGPGGAAAAENEATPKLYRVEVGHRLDAKQADGTTNLAATSIRFFPSTLQVHRGDVIYFWGTIFMTPVVLLPPPWTPTTDPKDTHPWLAKDSEIAHDLDDPWYFVEFDPDEPTDDPLQRPTKVNNRVVFPPPCGGSESRACLFPQPPTQLVNLSDPASYRPDATHDPVLGALGSGMGAPTDPLQTKLYVKIDAEPGTTIWATMLTAIGMNMRIDVVDDAVPATDPSTLEDLRLAQIAADEQSAHDADVAYADYSVREPRGGGSFMWEALAGLEIEGITILQSYPHQLRIRRGDVVRWRSEQLPAQYHTITFPEQPALPDPKSYPHDVIDSFDPNKKREGRPLFEIVCDPDTDEGSAPDHPTIFPSPVFCPGGLTQVEIDLFNYAVYRAGDGRFEGGEDEFETSGIIGAAPPPAPGFAPFDLEFPVRSPESGFKYVCLLHPGMVARVVVSDNSGVGHKTRS